MLKVFNTHALSTNQRFTRAILVGVPTALGCALVYGVISAAIRIEFSLVFVGIGWLIGTVIKKYGRGVQPKFSILAAVLAAFSFVLADLVGIFGLALLLHPVFLGEMLVQIIPSYLQASPSALLGLAFRAFGVYMAYTTARIV